MEAARCDVASFAQLLPRRKPYPSQQLPDNFLMAPPSMQNLHASNGMSWPAANLYDPNASSSGLQSLVPPSSTPRKPPKDSLESLVALPVVRPIPWIEGKELPSEKSTHSARIQTRGAFLLSTRGSINEPPCTHCKTGSGRFALCISLPSWFGGACSTCQMATRANLCSIRVEREQRRSGWLLFSTPLT
jgi:hypothetical protein